MLGVRTAQVVQRPKLARNEFGEMVRISASARSTGDLLLQLPVMTGYSRIRRDTIHFNPSTARLIQIKPTND